jgi:DnaJ-class molecular chaperone
VQTYYELLGVQREVPFYELLRAFKQKSLATHPTRNPNDLTVNTVKFRNICEAFDVLSHVELRAIYDKHGEYGLKEGIIESGKRVGGGYFLAKAPEAVFDSVFNSVDPWADQPNLDGSDLRGSLMGDAF